MLRTKLALAMLLAGATTAVVAPASAAAAPTRFEAENATISQGVVEANHTGFSGTGFVNYDNVVGSSVQWTVNATSAGAATIALRFANGTAVNRPMDITVNGVLVAGALSFGPTTNWDTWATATISATISAALSDDTVRIWLDGTLVLDSSAPHQLRLDSFTRALTAGQRYAIRIEHTEGTGEAYLKLLWSSPSTGQQIVPATQLYSS
jgi:hypothetical protein